jgi:pyruvate dehydrogenase E2 component (dihydrolipoamide acetyltransferase)
VIHGDARLPPGAEVATIRPMRTSRKLLAVSAGAFVFVVSSLTAAIAQTPVDPSTTPTENTGGWVFTMAQLLAVLGIGVVIFLVVMYMRYAPRFAKDEESLRVVRADRVRPGQALPRRDVDISQAAPVVVAPPAVPVAVGAAAPAAPAPAAPAAPAAAPAPAPATPAPAPAPAPATSAPEAAAVPATAAPPPTAPAAPAERVEVTLDQAVFDEKLAELLEKGTDRRVAEGQARRAAMIAARKKAEGG